MALKLYRRHRKECEGAHPEDTRTGEFEEGRRGWKKCGCLIHVSGTLDGKFNRRQTGNAEWDEAKALVALLEKSGSWDGQDKIEAPLTLPPQTPTPDGLPFSCDSRCSLPSLRNTPHRPPNGNKFAPEAISELLGREGVRRHRPVDAHRRARVPCFMGGTAQYSR